MSLFERNKKYSVKWETKKSREHLDEEIPPELYILSLTEGGGLDFHPKY